MGVDAPMAEGEGEGAAVSAAGAQEGDEAFSGAKALASVPLALAM